MLLKKNSFTAMVILLGALILPFGCSSDKPESAGSAGGEAKKSEKVYTLRIGDTTAPGDVLNVSLEEMAKAINERAGGRIKATVYPSGQLGSLRTMTEALQNNTLEMATQSPGGVASFWPVIGVLELPYLYENHQEVYKIVDGPIGQELNQKFLEKSGVRIMAYWMNFFRQTTNNVRPVKNLEDMKGLKLRVPETKTVMETIKYLGANPIPMAFSEVYTGLSQGAIDGQENPFTVVYAAKLYEVQKYLSLTKHVYTPVIVMVSEEWYKALPEDLRQIIDEEMVVARGKARELSERQDEELREKLTDMMEINEVDLTGFREAVQPVYDNMVSSAGQEAADYIKRITEELGR